MERERALVTGASSGIGRELARLAAQDGKDLILVARSGTALDELARELQAAHGVQAAVIPTDLGAPGAARGLHQEVEARGLQVDILINNAGYGVAGPFVSTDGPAELGIIQLNVAALTELAKLFVPAMVKRGRGRVLNVASTAGFFPGPNMAVYYASKAYVLSFTEALAHELKGTGVTATALCPGPTPSGFQQRSGMQNSWLLRTMLKDAGFVARTGYRAMLRGQVVVVPGLINKLATFSTRLLPRTVVAAVGALANSWRQSWQSCG